ncbi:MAG: 50S ribosomal protein L11 methyltransferase [Actinomycetota bacterium]|nr:50S ribosomal protein L11 methyltransferase [Actinomycetota bacterium]
MIELFPEGFEEVDLDDGVELAAYTDAAGEERLRAVFQGTSSADVEDDWANRWRSFHRPVRIGHLWIGPPWETPPVGALAVVIDPGLAFGTGNHPTTRLCLELLLSLEPTSLLDLGCGSGVISIAAGKLGFGPLFALDREDQAIAATRRNAAANRVAVDAQVGDVLADELPAAELAVANIELGTASSVVPRLRSPTVMLSGYVESAHPELAGFGHRERRTLDGWAADLYARE